KPAVLARPKASSRGNGKTHEVLMPTRIIGKNATYHG
ncbi:MAG: hypothetical protein QOE16_567, partial [Microbacteriaceae bacterium]|nr:hypothetical protein [Microbacteriaceae bacterium]